MNFSVFTKPICRFLIHRYMGQYLKTELTSDQLEFHLADGTATVQDVMLNTEYINEALDSSGIRCLSLVDGYVKELTVCVPFFLDWKRLLSDSTLIKVNGLEITLTTLAEINMENTQELVSSFIGSIASSLDLAKSVIVDEHLSAGDDNSGIEQFAGLIDQIITRIKVVFENVVIRIESYSELCSGIEVRIDKMEFLDERLEEQLKSINGPITEQPSYRQCTTTDLNKFLHVQGIRLFTDIWTPLKDRLTNSRMNSSDSEFESDMATSSTNFQSCYSHFSGRSNSNTVPRPQNSIPPNPILFGQLLSGQHTIRIRANNNGAHSDNSFGKKIDIDVVFGGSLFLFLTPSQIIQLKELFSLLIPKNDNKIQTKSNSAAKVGGLPMNQEHYQRMMDEMQVEYFGTEQKQKFGFITGTWSGTEQFYDLNEHNLVGNLSDGRTRRSSHSVESGFERTNRRSTASISTLVDRRPDVFTFTMRAPSFIAVLTNDDPLSLDSISQHGLNNFAAIRAIISDMANRANRFFSVAETLKMSRMKLIEQRELFSQLYENNSLRFVANVFFLSFNSTNDSIRNIVEFEGQLEECDFIECLRVEQSQAFHLQFIDIFNLSGVNFGNGSRSSLTFKIYNTFDRQQDYNIIINMEHCTTDLDPTLISRMMDLIHIRPFFSMYKNACQMQILESEIGGLRDNFMPETLEQSEIQTSVHLKCYCSNWVLNLRSPKQNAQECTKQNICQEYMKMEFEAAELELPKFLLNDASMLGTIDFRCKTAKGTLIGDPKVLECAKENLTFFFAETSNAEREVGNIHGFKIKFSYDMRNKLLSRALINNENMMARSMCDSIFYANDQNGVEGPFSTKDAFHFDDTFGEKTDETNRGSKPFIKAGNREKLMDFAEESRTLSNFVTDIFISKMNMSLTSKKFFEVLYNRFKDQLALWEHSLNHRKINKNINQFMECHSAFMLMQGCEKDEENNSDELPSESDIFKTTKNELKKRNGKTDSHCFSLGIHVDKCRILLQNKIICQSQEVEVDRVTKSFMGQIGLELTHADVFFVYGFKGNPNLSYFFITSKNAGLMNKNLLGGKIAFSNNVYSQTFLLPKNKNDIYLEELPWNESGENNLDNNFVVSIKIHFCPDTNIQDIFLAFGLHNSLVHLCPFSNVSLFWGKQIVDFFTIADCSASSEHILPIVNLDFRLHFSNVFLHYDHSSIITDSPFQLRFEIGSSYITSHFAHATERLKFDCIFEDIKLWIGKKVSESVKFEEIQLPNSELSNPFVKVLMSNSVHFILAYAVSFDQIPGPLFDLAFADHSLAIWICSDTIVDLINLANEIYRSETLKNLLESNNSNADLQKKKVVEMINKSIIVGAGCQNGVNISHTSAKQSPIISSADEERLIKLMESAINDMPLVKPESDHRKNSIHGISEEMDRGPEFSPNSGTSDNTDDEFIMIEKIAPTAKRPGVGVTKIGNRLQTRFDAGGDFEFVTTQINISPSSDNAFDDLNSNLPHPLLRYKIRFSLLKIYLFGGTDFGDSARSFVQKTYSQWETNKSITEADQIGSQGGRYRDHTVFVEVNLSKLFFTYELFNSNSPYLTKLILKIGDFEVTDHLFVSQINQMVHRLQIEGHPRSSSPFLSVCLLEDQLREAKVQVSLAPIRFNLDQDTLEFIMDFKNDLDQGLKNTFEIPILPQPNTEDDVPIMEIPKHALVVHQKPCINTKLEEGISFSSLKDMDERENAANLDDLFSEDDINLSDSFCEHYRNDLDTSQQQPECSDNVGESIFASSSMHNSDNAFAAKDTFIKDFCFSPACRLRIDYEAKRIKTNNLLAGLTNLKKAELVLIEIRSEKGFLGFGRCFQFVMDEWIADIKNKQYPNVVGSIASINALVQLAQGFRDLFVLPLEEFKKENGQLVLGIHKGTSSFGINAATATIDATQRVVGLVQNVAELTYDIVNPNFAYQRYNDSRVQIAGDLREGFSFAYSTVREGVLDTAQTLRFAAEQDRSRGGWGLGIIRHLTPTAIKPIVVVSKATSHLLGGLKNQLKPEEHREEVRKWRQNALNRQGVDTLKRQSSSASMVSSSSTGSFTRSSAGMHQTQRK